MSPEIGISTPPPPNSQKGIFSDALSHPSDQVDEPMPEATPEESTLQVAIEQDAKKESLKSLVIKLGKLVTKTMVAAFPSPPVSSPENHSEAENPWAELSEYIYQPDATLPELAYDEIGAETEPDAIIEPESLAEQGPQIEEIVAPQRPESLASAEVREAARLLESQGYVKDAPDFDEQLADATRTNTFSYEASGRSMGTDPPVYEIRTVTEQEGMVRLAAFLDEYIAFETASEVSSQKGLNNARDIRENLTLIGDKEYKEAVAGLGELWKTFLAENPSRQLCISKDIAKFYSGGSPGMRKSDAYLFDQIMAQFSEEELALYRDRIVFDPARLTCEAADARIVLLDDWTISGSQLRSTYDRFTGEPWFAKYSSQMELNLVVSPKGRIENGFDTRRDDVRLPVRSYFVAHDAVNARYEHKARISGTHSSVDYDFECDIQRMVDRQKQATHQNVVMPPLTNIVRPYRRTEPLFVQDSEGKIIRNKKKE